MTLHVNNSACTYVYTVTTHANEENDPLILENQDFYGTAMGVQRFTDTDSVLENEQTQGKFIYTKYEYIAIHISIITVGAVHKSDKNEPSTSEDEDDNYGATTNATKIVDTADCTLRGGHNDGNVLVQNSKSLPGIIYMIFHACSDIKYILQGV